MRWYGEPAWHLALYRYADGLPTYAERSYAIGIARRLIDARAEYPDADGHRLSAAEQQVIYRRCHEIANAAQASPRPAS